MRQHLAGIDLIIYLWYSVRVMMAERPEHEPIPKPTTLEDALEVIEMLHVALAQKDAEAQRDPLIQTMLHKTATHHLIERRVEEGRPFGIFLIDLNNFKSVNDTIGHAKGDELLVSFGQHLRKGFRRETDEISLMSEPEQGRVGGDEFVVIVGLSKNQRRENNLHSQTDKLYYLLREIEESFLEDNPDAADLGVGLSIGAAVFNPAHPVDAATLYDMADEAMYEEKGTFHAGLQPYTLATIQSDARTTAL